MFQSIGFFAFCDAFRSADRNENFTYEGKRILFDYLENLEEETDTKIELDVIALCCEYNQDTWQDIADNYDINLSDCDDDDGKMDTVRDYLNDNTSVCGETDDSFVYAIF